MEKILKSMLIAIAAICMVGCSNDNTPANVVKAALEAINNKDCDAYAEQCYSRNIVQLHREQLHLYEDLLANVPDEHLFEDFKIIREEYYSSSAAVVEYEITLLNGETKNKTCTIIQDDDNGKWKIETDLLGIIIRHL